MSNTNPTQIHGTAEGTGFIPAPGDKGKPITVVGRNSIRAGFDTTYLQQVLNVRSAPGVSGLVLNPDPQRAMVRRSQACSHRRRTFTSVRSA